jgi:hypothetical protein
LCQTGGDKPYTLPTPGFDLEVALSSLEIRRIDFDMFDGNVQGFARGRSVAVSPVAQLPHKTTFHELGHVLLGHTEESTLVDEESTPRCIREVEAECVALLCCEALGLPGTEYCRGYVQHWLAGKQEIPAQSVQKILTVASQILKAGQTARIG